MSCRIYLSCLHSATRFHRLTTAPLFLQILRQSDHKNLQILNQDLFVSCTVILMNLFPFSLPCKSCRQILLCPLHQQFGISPDIRFFLYFFLILQGTKGVHSQKHVLGAHVQTMNVNSSREGEWRELMLFFVSFFPPHLLFGDECIIHHAQHRTEKLKTEVRKSHYERPGPPPLS